MLIIPNSNRFDLSDRLMGFAVSVSEIVNGLPKHQSGSHVAGQLFRSGTAPAAHYAEAQSAESRRDFIHKLRLALKELRESIFWLNLARRMELTRGRQLIRALAECNELISIFVKSISTARRNEGQD